MPTAYKWETLPVAVASRNRLEMECENKEPLTADTLLWLLSSFSQNMLKVRKRLAEVLLVLQVGPRVEEGSTRAKWRLREHSLKGAAIFCYSTCKEPKALQES